MNELRSRLHECESKCDYLLNAFEALKRERFQQEIVPLDRERVQKRQRTSDDRIQSVRKRYHLPKILNAEEEEKFLQTWNRKYVCNYFDDKDDCRFQAYECKRLHAKCEPKRLINELRHVNANKQFADSKFFSHLFDKALKSQLPCLPVMQKLKKHVEDITGISFKNKEKNKLL